MKEKVDVLGSPSLIVRRVSVHVKQYRNITVRAQELCERGGGRPGLPFPNSPYGYCGRKAKLKKKKGSGGTYAEVLSTLAQYSYNYLMNHRHQG